MTRRTITVWLVPALVILLGAVGVTFAMWPEGSSAEDRERSFCWKVSARVASDGADSEAKRGAGSVSECAAELQKAAKMDRAALGREVISYGKNVEKNPDGMPVAVRRALGRALAERPGLVYESFASGGARESGDSHPYLNREALSFVVLALSHDDAALRALRSSQESYVRSRIEKLSRDDFDQGMKSSSAKLTVESVGRVTGALTTLAQGARQNASRGEYADYYARHGYPRIRNEMWRRGRALGVGKATLQNSGSSVGDLLFSAETAYNRAANTADVTVDSGEG